MVPEPIFLVISLESNLRQSTYFEGDMFVFAIMISGFGGGVFDFMPKV